MIFELRKNGYESQLVNEFDMALTNRLLADEDGKGGITSFLGYILEEDKAHNDMSAQHGPIREDR